MIQIGTPDGGKRKTEDGTVQIRPMCPADIPAVAELDRKMVELRERIDAI